MIHLSKPKSFKMKKITSTCALVFFPFLLLLFAGCASTENQNKAEGEEWISLFNGEDLDDWHIKFTGYELGYNYNNTFRVEDGLLTVSYDEWGQWGGEFGHIFYKEPFSHYILRLEYRFIGEQVPGGPGWAFRNNGVMLHCQAPETMTKDQEFPVSVETQLLGGNDTDERSTANVCTPGTHIVMDGELITRHCINSSSETYHGDQWVTLEIEVRGSEVVRHIMDGEVVFEYTEPQLDEGDGDAQRLIAERNTNDLLVDRGYISLQAESHPTQFRKIEIKVLEEQ